VASCGETPEFELVVAVTIVGGALEARVAREPVTGEMRITVRKDEMLNSIKLTVFCLGTILCRFPLFLKLFNDCVQQMIQKFMGILMHGPAEVFLAFLEFVNKCFGCYRTLISRMCRNKEEEGPESRKESRRGGWNRVRRLGSSGERLRRIVDR